MLQTRSACIWVPFPKTLRQRHLPVDTCTLSEVRDESVFVQVLSQRTERGERMIRGGVRGGTGGGGTGGGGARTSCRPSKRQSIDDSIAMRMWSRGPIGWSYSYNYSSGETMLLHIGTREAEDVAANRGTRLQPTWTHCCRFSCTLWDKLCLTQC